jgi:predicted  nucleic acid-binding Zn-ribbon protein
VDPMKEQLRLVIKLHEVNKLMTELLEAFEGLKVEGINDEEIELIMAEFRHITQGKEGIMDHVRHDLQNLYKRFYARYGEDAITQVQDDICTGCFVKISPMKLARIRKMDSLEYCESCGRILIPPKEK